MWACPLYACVWYDIPEKFPERVRRVGIGSLLIQNHIHHFDPSAARLPTKSRYMLGQQNLCIVLGEGKVTHGASFLSQFLGLLLSHVLEFVFFKPVYRPRAAAQSTMILAGLPLHFHNKTCGTKQKD